MSSDSDDKKDTEEKPDMRRRKLMYAAPILMSQRMFNAVTGCGKVQPNVQSCALVSFSS